MRIVSLTAWAVAVGVSPGATALAVAPPEDPAVREGAVMIADPDRPDEWLLEGDSNSAFALRLPTAASCPGDSRNDQYRVQTFIVPTASDLGSLSYSDVGPTGEHQFALYSATADQTSFAQVLTAPNETPGQPGVILGLPVFGFGVYPADSLPAGRYAVGVACTYFRWTTNYWSTEIDVIDDSSSRPGGFRWAVVQPTESFSAAGEDRSASKWLLAGGVLALIGFVATFFVGRHRTGRDHPSPVKETFP
jgi:hypothetical protein